MAIEALSKSNLSRRNVFGAAALAASTFASPGASAMPLPQDVVFAFMLRRFLDAVERHEITCVLEDDAILAADEELAKSPYSRIPYRLPRHNKHGKWVTNFYDGDRVPEMASVAAIDHHYSRLAAHDVEYLNRNYGFSAADADRIINLLKREHAKIEIYRQQSLDALAKFNQEREIIDLKYGLTKAVEANRAAMQEMEDVGSAILSTPPRSMYDMAVQLVVGFFWRDSHDGELLTAFRSAMSATGLDAEPGVNRILREAEGILAA